MENITPGVKKCLKQLSNAGYINLDGSLKDFAKKEAYFINRYHGDKSKLNLEFQFVCEYGLLDRAKKLYECGANPTANNFKALEMAKIAGHNDVVEWLERLCADSCNVNNKDNHE